MTPGQWERSRETGLIVHIDVREGGWRLVHPLRGGRIVKTLPAFRLLCHALTLILIVTMLTGTPRLAVAAPGAPVAVPGQGPVQRGVPASAAPRHGLSDGVTAPAVPPAIEAAGKPVSAAVAARTAEPAVLQAVDPLLRPGYLLGDTSLVLYFNGDLDRGNPQSWARWWVTVTDVASGAEQRSADLGQNDVADCGTPREFCRSLGAAEGWVLNPAREYHAVITVVQADGSEAASPPSNPAEPRTTDVPPALPAGQAVGCGCPTVLGPVLNGQAIRGAGVNTATGAFSRTEHDFVMASYGIPFSASRYYSSANPAVGMFGTGWSWTYDAQVVAAEGSVRVRAEDGSEAVYTRRADGAFDVPAGIRSTLTTVDGGWQLLTPDQRRVRFDTQGRLVSVKNARGHGVTLAYDTDGLVSTITDASGRVVRLEWRRDLRRIFKITLPDNRSAQFDYEAGRLAKIQDPRGFTTQYRYGATGLLTEVVDARGAPAIRNEYTAGRVVRQLDPEGGATTFTTQASTDGGADTVATTRDPDGVETVDGYRNSVLIYSRNANQDVVNHRYDGRLRRNLVVDAKGNQESTGHDANGNPVSRTAPEPFAYTTENTFDDRNNMTAHKDGRGNTWRYTFNDNNEMTGQSDPGQKGYEYTYDAKGQVVTRTDQRDKTTRYEYDTHGNRTAEISPTGRRTEMTYDLTGRMTTIVDPRGTVTGADPARYRTRIVYDQQSRVREVWQPGKSQPSRTDYDELGNPVVVTDPLANSTRLTYDRNSRVVTVKDPIGNVTSKTWTPGGRLATETDGQGNVTSRTYDSEGRQATETSPRGNLPGADKTLFTTVFHYDYNGNLIQADRPYGSGGQRVQVDTGFDEMDRPVEQRDEFNVATKVGYDANGNVTEMTDEKGQKLTHSFDSANRRTGSTGASGAAAIEYDDAGNPLKQTTPNGGVITWRYDDDGRPVSITEPRGNVAGADPDAYTTRYAYDPAGNLETTTDPLGNVTRTAYDANNQVVSVTDPKSQITRYTYDAADRLASVLGPDASGEQQSTRYTYDANGNVIKRTDPLGRVSSLEYDRAGRAIVSTDPLGRRREMVYDADSNLIEQVTARQVDSDQPDRPDPIRPARTIFYTYDNLNRLIAKRMGADGFTYTFGYDAKNRLVSSADPGGVQDRVYDRTGRLTEVQRGAEVFTYGYDDDDRITARTYPDGTRITAEYDEGDRITALTSAKGGNADRYGFTYDVADNLTRVTHPSSTGYVEDRGYDRAGRLTSVATTKGDQVVAGFDLTLDPAGNPTNVTSQRTSAGTPTITETTAYLYDKANRLTSACYGATTCAGASGERIDYTYDLVGNRATQKRVAPGENTTATYTYDAADQLTRETVTGTAASTRAFEYDLEGNQTRTGGETYTYALDHTMTSATVSGVTTVYQYDGSGNRISATTGAGAGQTVQKWAWDVNAGGMPQLAVDSTGGTSRSFLYDPAGSPLALLAGDGAHTYARDWLGGVAAVVSPTGAAEWSYRYDPFGKARGTGLTDGGTKLSDTAPDNPMRYAGGYHDDSQGDRYQLRARNYDPGTGRFDAQDPVSQPATDTAISAYAYADNRPSVLTDPTGRDPISEHYESIYNPNYQAPAPLDPQTSAQCEADTSDPECVDNPGYLDAKNLVDEADKFVKQIADEIVNLILDLVGFNDAKACVTEGDIVACISTALQAVPWGKLFKAAKVMIKAVGVGRRLIEAYGKLKSAKAALANIPRKLKRAGATADEAADTNKYKKAVESASSGAKETGQQAKQTTRKATEGAKKQQRKEGCNSFAAGTLVVMADGTAEPIEDVRPGDAVLATDPETGRSASRQVTAAIEGTGDKTLVDLTLTGDGEELTATGGHPFWVRGRGWVPAAEVHDGDRLRDTTGRDVEVLAVEVRGEHTTVHNLTVADIHTYYVRTPSGIAALNHNDNDPGLIDLRGQVGAACPLRQVSESDEFWLETGGGLFVPGPYAARSIASRSRSQTFDEGQRFFLNQIGDRYGCHTCGVPLPGTKTGWWIPDHQPVSFFVPPGTTQRLFPHCAACSFSQMRAVSVWRAKGWLRPYS
nr:hypothetical protein Aca09nite_49620 [Actinoplanes campanulatus]